MSNLQKGEICKFQNQYCVVNSSPIYSSAYVVDKNTDKYENRWTAACNELNGVVRKLGLGGSDHSSLVSCYLKQLVV